MQPPADPPHRTITITPAADAAAPSADLERGAAFGRYLVLDRLGSGGMGVVYSAYDPELDRRVAIKILKPEASDHQSRLLREARAIARLQHAGVVAVYDVGTYEGRVFIAMELVEGTTLQHWLETARTWREVVEVFLKAGRGLAAAHDAELVHRDFKPANVLVGSDGRVRVADFGLARSIARDDSGEATPRSSPAASSPAINDTITRTGALLGTPSYMSPEQFAGQPADARSDQFSFCVALYRALYGDRPFAGDDLATIRPEVLAGRLRRPPNDARVPKWVRDIVMRGLATQAEQRWPSMNALLAALERDSVRARRRWLVAGGAVAALVALSVGYRNLQRREGLVCSGAERSLVGIWDEARKGAVHRAFAATDAPFAERSFQVVAQMLDKYSRAWASVHTDSCEATRRRREQSEEILDLRMECLGQRLQELKAQTDLFANADGNVVERSVQMASALSSLDGCSDVAALRAPVRPPADPETRMRAEKVEAKVTQVQALVLAGKYQQALALAGPVAEEARALKYRPLEGRALYWLGSMQGDTGDPVTAQKTLEEAVLAARAGRDAVQETYGWAGLVRLARRQARYEQANSWARFGLASAEAVGKSDERPLGLLLLARSAVAGEQGRHAEAIADGRRALAIREAAFGAESAQVAATLSSLAIDAAAMGRHDESEREARRGLTITEKLLGPVHPAVADALYSLAHAVKGQGRADEALALYQRCVSVNEKTRGSESTTLIVPLSNIGGILGEQGKNDQALSYLRRALAIGEKAYGLKHPDLAAVLMNMGGVLQAERKYDDAVALYRRALTIFEDAKHAPQYQATALTLIGVAELERHQPARAVAPLRRALGIWDAAGPGDASDVSDTQFALARALWDIHPGDERARDVAIKARAGYASAGETSKKDLTNVDTWLSAHGR